jgi:hypothetical protein
VIGVAEALAEADEELDREAEEDKRSELLTIAEKELDRETDEDKRFELLTIVEEEPVMLAEIDEELDTVALVDEAELAMLDKVAGAELEDEDEDGSDGVINLYIVNLFGPPQISAALPLQGMLHNVSPSGAGPPPLFRALPQ